MSPVYYSGSYISELTLFIPGIFFQEQHLKHKAIKESHYTKHCTTWEFGEVQSEVVKMRNADHLAVLEYGLGTNITSASSEMDFSTNQTVDCQRNMASVERRPCSDRCVAFAEI